MSRYDEFEDFDPGKTNRKRADRKAVEMAAQEAGFGDRTPQPVKEPLKSLSFRLTASEVDSFHELAYRELGPGYGSVSGLFRKMRKFYEEHHHGGSNRI
jgi:hypothetical protein